VEVNATHVSNNKIIPREEEDSDILIIKKKI